MLEPRSVSRLCVLAICFKNGDIKLVNSYDDVSPVLIRTGFQTMQTQWSNSGELLAVAGRVSMVSSSSNVPENSHLNRVSFFSETGASLATFVIPYYKSAVTALTWGHNDKRLFLATGTQVHIGWISKKIPSLQLLCRLKIHKTLKDSTQVECLPLPCRLKTLISSLFTNSIKCHIPEKRNLKKFVSRPPNNGLRFYCTMIRHGDEATGSNYTIYLEHLGGFLPILKGKKTSKIKPEFVIFDPLKDIDNTFQKTRLNGIINNSLDATSDTDFTDPEDSHETPAFYSPRLRRRQRRRRRRNQPHYFGYSGNEEVDYLNTLPEEERMVEIRSNIWGTKFKIHGIDISLPPLLGQISYKASLLHLQPRQMRLIVTEMREDLSLSYNINNNKFSDDEEDNDKVTMEDEVLTAVTARQAQIATVAPIPSISNRLSVADFQKLNSETPATPGDINHSWQQFSSPTQIPQVEVTVAGPESGTNPGFETDISAYQKLRKLGMPNFSQPLSNHTRGEVVVPAQVTTVDFDPNLGKWCLKHLSGSKSYDQQLDHSVIETVSGTNVGCLRRGRVRRDSVGASNSTSSSRSSLASPRRWAAKAEELHENEAEPSIFPARAPATGSRNTCPRSCSADHLGAIVDILGVPTGAPQIWENPRRLILSAEKKKIEMKRNLANMGKSKSLDTEESAESDATSPEACDIFKNCQSQHRVENNCRNCSGSDRARDLELNKEMFDVSCDPCDEDENESKPLLSDNLTPRSRRKFDSVRNLLEKARAKLSLKTRSRHNSTSSDEQKSRDSEHGSPLHLPRNKLRERLSVPDQQVSQSSPNTPLMARKIQSKRHQSFSPVRTLLNSPLLRRKKSLFDSSEEDISDAERLRQRTGRNGYQNLETFQKQKLRQKLRKLNTLDVEASEDLREKEGKLRGLGRTSSPESSPRLCPRQAKEFVMHNKAPLWNEGSQVYQLDFGGRVTQESAKNFQIEYLGKQVMQFGRIDENAYTLDFQYPLTALQAFSVALANVTQRLK